MNTNFNNYYEILNVNINATEDEIYQAYNIKIAQFNHLPFHTNKMIVEIKLLKEAIYVLGDEIRRKKYNNKYEKIIQYEEMNNKSVDNTKICDRLFSITF
jgi:DnaJ-class molecular chaperone